jgi:hypothetical protein
MVALAGIIHKSHRMKVVAANAECVSGRDENSTQARSPGRQMWVWGSFKLAFVRTRPFDRFHCQDARTQRKKNKETWRLRERCGDDLRSGLLPSE